MSTSSEKDLKPRGRSLRSKLSDQFVEALAADFESNGAAVIEKVRTENPAIYVQVAAKLVPAEAHIVNENANAYADCQSTGELAERLLLENGATTVTATMRKRAIAELERHAKAIEVIAVGKKAEPIEEPNNRKARLMREARKPFAKLPMPWAPTTN